MIMKRYLVTLKDGRDQFVDAEGYHRHGDQYVFQRNDSEAQFFQASAVLGIITFREDVGSGGTSISVPLA